LEHEEKAKELFEQGYNCAQSVFAAFAGDLGFDFETALKLSSPFGGGMGRLREVCGAVSALLMIAGLRYGYTGTDDDEAKGAHYALVQRLAFRFKEENGSYICRELLGLPEGEQSSPVPEKRTAAYYGSRPCAEYVACAARLAEELLQKEPEL
jgi:C_GCAxxG_C_C family probable redox protein